MVIGSTHTAMVHVLSRTSCMSGQAPPTPPRCTCARAYCGFVTLLINLNSDKVGKSHGFPPSQHLSMHTHTIKLITITTTHWITAKYVTYHLHKQRDNHMVHTEDFQGMSTITDHGTLLDSSSCLCKTDIIFRMDLIPELSTQ